MTSTCVPRQLGQKLWWQRELYLPSHPSITPRYSHDQHRQQHSPMVQTQPVTFKQVSHKWDRKKVKKIKSLTVLHSSAMSGTPALPTPPQEHTAASGPSPYFTLQELQDESPGASRGRAQTKCKAPAEGCTIGINSHLKTDVFWLYSLVLQIWVPKDGCS